MNLKKILTGVALLVLVGAACTAGGGGPSVGRETAPSEPVTIGLVGPFSGPLASIGRNMREGVTLAVEDLNRGGGVLGHPVDVVERDSENSETKTAEIVREFVEKQRVALIIGPPSNSAYPAIEDYILRQKTITMPIITSQQLKRRVNPYVFRIMIPDDIQVDLMVRYVVGALGIRKLGVVATDDAGGRDFVALTRTSLSAQGLRPTTVKLFSPDDLDLSPISLELKRSGAQGIIFGSHIGPYAARLATANRNLGYGAPIFGFAGLTSYTYADLAREAAIGTIFVAVPIFSTVDRSRWSQAVSDFYERYTARYFKDGTRSAAGADKVIGAAFLTYDGVRMWARAATEAGSVDPVKVQPVLTRARYGPQESVGNLSWAYTPTDHEGIHEGDMWFYRWVKDPTGIHFELLGTAGQLLK